MKTRYAVAIALFSFTLSWEAVAQDLNIDQLQAEPPAGWSASAAPIPTAGGLPQFGYQFQYGSFSVQPGGPPTVDGIFTLTTQQFPQGAVQKLYHESLTYVGFSPGGPNEGAVFRCSINGNARYFLFGTVSQGTQNGIELRRIRYFDQNLNPTYSTNSRFYAP